MGTGVLSTGDKILYTMKDMDMGIPGLAALSGVREDTLLDIMAGIREADITTLCQIADALGVCVRELCPDQERYTVPVEKNTLAKLIVVSEINGVVLSVSTAPDRQPADRVRRFGYHRRCPLR